MNRPRRPSIACGTRVLPFVRPSAPQATADRAVAFPSSSRPSRRGATRNGATMAHTRRTSRRRLILLGAILLLFVVAVVWVMVVRDRGTTGTVQMITTQENAPQENAPGSADGDATASKDEGWFTEEQATGGQEAYAQACAQCHGEELQGGVGPALTGQTFWDHWGGDTVYTFFEYIRRMMRRRSGKPRDRDLHGRHRLPPPGERVPARRRGAAGGRRPVCRSSLFAMR